MVRAEATLSRSQVTSSRSIPRSAASGTTWRRASLANPRRRALGRTPYPTWPPTVESSGWSMWWRSEMDPTYSSGRSGSSIHQYVAVVQPGGRGLASSSSPTRLATRRSNSAGSSSASRVKTTPGKSPSAGQLTMPSWADSPAASNSSAAARKERWKRRCGVASRTMSRLCQPCDDGVEHGLGELAGEGVLLAHVVAADEPDRPPLGRGEDRLGGVAEPRLGPRDLPAQAARAAERGVPPDRAQGQHRAQPGRGQR